MVSKSQISFLKSLQQKKYRKEHGLFIVEGYKSVHDFLLSGYTVETIFFTPQFEPKMLKVSGNIKLEPITTQELDKISSLNTPQHVLATVMIPPEKRLDNDDLKGRFSLVLDGLQDPGNLGTIIRTADWFGISHIICSPDTVDAYNPKVVQASMGSLARINVHYQDLLLLSHQINIPVFGAMLDGENIYKVDFGTEGLIVLGNEGNGISQNLQQQLTHKITIPKLGAAESLNVSIAAAIFCTEVFRNLLK